MRSEKAQLVFTDPPYNVAIQGHVGGRGRTKHREFPMGVGEFTPDEFQTFLRTAFHSMRTASVDGSLHYIFMDWRHLHEAIGAGVSVYGALKNLCVWVKSNGGQGSLYRSRHELVLVFKHGTAAHLNNVELGRHGRNRTNVWEYAGVNTFKRGRIEELSAHPTVKPVALVMDAIKDCTRRNDVLLDPFAGSGTTLLAAERTGRQARLIELDPLYVDLTVDRWQKLTGRAARLAGSNRTFDQMRSAQSERPRM